MLIFTHLDQIPPARLPTHLAEYITSLLKNLNLTLPHYDPEEDGFLALATPRDTDISLGERLGRRWSESCFEGISYDQTARCFLTLILRNNQYCIQIVIPDEPWLDAAIRERLNRES